MTYLALARKYRPKNFAEMAGQSHILRTLTHALENNRLHHAYLLTGTRGVGKTSLARILAKCFNCENGITANPCESCSHCLSINQGKDMDVIEIDAASRTRVEDTRELLDNTQYAPNQARFKIYIIDEVHMLSGHSFNALLKTLEEPPPHVKFLLATTDPQKLPVTVLSRCLQLHLKNISPDIITAQLENVLAQEKIPADKSGLDLIAKAAEGSMRDALSLLDQAINYTQGKLLENDLAQMLGQISRPKIIELIKSAHAKKITALLAVIDDLEINGADFFKVFDEMLSIFQQIAVSQFTGKALYPDLTLSPEDIQLYYQIILMGKRDLPLAPDPKSGFIMTLLRLMAFSPKNNKSNADFQSESAPIPASTPISTTISTPNTSKSVLKSSSEPPLNWSSISQSLELSGITKLLADNCVLTRDAQDSGVLHLTLDKNYEALLTPQAKENLMLAIKNYYHTHYQISCEIKLTIGKSGVQTPFEAQTTARNEKIKQAKNDLLSDNHVQAFMQTFSAKLHTLTMTTEE